MKELGSFLSADLTFKEDTRTKLVHPPKQNIELQTETIGSLKKKATFEIRKRRVLCAQHATDLGNVVVVMY